MKNAQYCDLLLRYSSSLAIMMGIKHKLKCGRPLLNNGISMLSLSLQNIVDCVLPTGCEVEYEF